MTLMKLGKGRCRVAASAALMAVAVAGCDGGPSKPSSTTTPMTSSEPNTSSTTEPASPTSTNPTYKPSKPKFPPMARMQTDEGAIAFLRYYLQSVDYAWSAPDAAILDHLAAPSCKLCTNLQQTAATSAKKHERSSGPVLTAGEVAVIGKSAGNLNMICDLDLLRVTYLDAKGRSIFEQKKKTLKWAAELEWQEGWRVVNLGER